MHNILKNTLVYEKCADEIRITNFVTTITYYAHIISDIKLFIL
jgi:hypothetical protein